MDEVFISNEEVEAYERKQNPARRSVVWSLAAVVTTFVLIGGSYAFGRWGEGGRLFTASLFGGTSEEQGETFPLWSAGREPNESFAKDLQENATISSGVCGFESGGAVKGGAVLMSEVAWMGTEDGAQYEWIELVNTGNAAVNMAGWSVVDKDEQIQVVFPKNAAISAGGFFLLARSTDRVGGIRADMRYAGNLKNENEGLRLFNGKCEVVDEVLAAPKWPAGETGERRTMERNLATKVWYTSSKLGGTPKATNSPPPLNVSQSETLSAHSTPQNVSVTSTAPTSTVAEEPVSQPSSQGTVMISEVMAGKDGATNWDFVELYNPVPNPINLTGWSVRKRSSSGTESPLVSATRLEGVVIPAGGYLLLAHPDYAGVPAADVMWPKSYTLAYKSNAAVLYNADGAKADEISWSEIPPGQSYALVGTSFAVGSPTPRTAP